MLVVDDSRTMRLLLTSLAKELAFETAQAEDGLAALEVLKSQPPFDIALVDWDMPRMTGIELVRAIRQDNTYAGLKLMMVTTQNSMDKVTAALESGADDFLMKPLNKEMLEEKLNILGLLNS